MSVKLREFLERFEEFCPLWLAEPGDPVGLHIGSYEQEVRRVLMTLDVRPEVVQEAIEKKVDLIIAKHPPIFKKIGCLLEEDPQQKMYMDLIRNHIAVYAAHTNMDIMENGLNDWFCDALDVKVEGYLRKTHETSYKKLVVYVPTSHAEELRRVLGDLGAGQQGNYHHTSYTLEGTGRFTPTEMANPTIGMPEKPEIVKEERIEWLYLEEIESKLVQAIAEVHPYEEPAYDLIRLENSPKTYGLGRFGEIPNEMDLEEFIQKVKETFSLDSLRLIEPANQKNKKIKKVAICGGSGEKFFKDALNKGADVYLTGDVYYHTAHDIQASGLTVIDPGHHIEALCVDLFVKEMQKWNIEKNWMVDILGSEVNTNPFQYR